MQRNLPHNREVLYVLINSPLMRLLFLSRLHRFSTTDQNSDTALLNDDYVGTNLALVNLIHTSCHAPLPPYV